MNPDQAADQKLQFLSVAVSVRDMQVSAAWYRQHLGFRFVEQFDAGNGVRFVMLEQHGFFIQLVQVPEQVELEKAPLGPPRHLSVLGYRSLAFYTDDLRACSARLKAAGQELIWDNQEFAGLGTRLTAFRDPDHNLVVIWQRNEHTIHLLNR